MGAGLGRLALAATVLRSGADPGARAASIVVIGNYPESNDGTLSSVTSLYGTYAKAVGFTMGGQSEVLASVTLRLAWSRSGRQHAFGGALRRHAVGPVRSGSDQLRLALDPVGRG